MLRAELARVRPSRVVTIGASMGGYAAIRAGLALGAGAVLAFGPQVFINPSQRDALGLPWMQYDAILRRLAGTCADCEVQMAPLTRVQRTGRAACTNSECGSTSTTIEIHVGGAASGDVKEAAMLREALRVQYGDAAAAGNATEERLEVLVFVHAGLTHALVKDLRAAGALERMLRAHL